MTNNQTIIIFISCLIYLVALPFILNAVASDNIDVGLESEDKSFFSTINEFTLNVATTVSDIPIWLNTILIIIPFAILIVTGILLILHG